MKDWLHWLGRGAQKERAYKELAAIQQAYGAQGERVIRLSRRTDEARQAAGSTKKAFESVETAFLRATQEYARIGELIEALEAGLSKGKVGDFRAVDEAVSRLGPVMDELDQNLAHWEQSWRKAPQQIDEAARSLAELRQHLDRATGLIGVPLPLSEQVANLEEHLEKIRQTLAAGNPLEVANQVVDLQLAQRRVSEQAATYASAAGAIAQAEQEIAEVKARLSGLPEPPAEAIGAMAAAEALVPRLRPALAAGKLDPFQQDLYQLQRHLSTARGLLK